MEYDPSRRALYHPELDDPVADFSDDWAPDQVCAELSRLAYYRFEAGDGQRLDTALNRAGFADHAPFTAPDTDTQGFGTVAANGTIWVAFRGTQPESLADILTDARFLPRPWQEGGRVHGGFRAAFAPLSESIENWLAGAGGGRLFVTGHSLGAAMATLTAATQPRAELVTFGSPVVGNRAFADLFAHRPVRRYVDCIDVVTAIPAGLVGYVHLGNEVYIDRRGRTRPAPPDLLTRSWDGVLARRDFRRCLGPGNVLDRSFADHAPINYVSALLGRRTGP